MPTHPLTDFLPRLVRREDLSRDEAFELLEALQKTSGEITPRLTADGARASTDEKISLDEKTYRFMHNQDPMAVDKLSEGIRRFYDDGRKLEQWAMTAVATA